MADPLTKAPAKPKRINTDCAHLGEQGPLRRSARLGAVPPKDAKKHTLATKKDSPEKLLPNQSKRPREDDSSSTYIQAESHPTKRRLSARQDKLLDNTDISFDLDLVDPRTLYWIEKGVWPKENSTSHPMAHMLARKSTTCLRRKRSEPGSLATSSTTPSDQKPRDEKSAPYQAPRYKTLLETKGSFMRKHGGFNGGTNEKSMQLCQALLETAQANPADTLFDNDIFDKTCDMIAGRNKAKVVQDITRLLVPSAQTLALRCAKFECLIESVNEGWNNSIPLISPHPQPNYSVGFRREAFSVEQREKLAPFISDFTSGDQSYFMATYYMYFPFLTCEVTAILEIADQQNAHSITLAVRAIIELFRLAKREKEVDQVILAFSISHDHRSVRIYGHYAIIDGPNTTFYRYPIHTFDFTAQNSKEKWTAYRFTKNIYDIWMPTHLARLCSAIDDLPSRVNFEVPSLQQNSGLSQDLSSHGDSQSGTRVTTTDTSFTKQGAPKRQRRKRAN
ncbi:hypothetical protein ACEQ8H_003729 [Pleosporales sp. CAS-2024a]